MPTAVVFTHYYFLLSKIKELLFDSSWMAADLTILLARQRPP
jgi:hypothetical protein